MKLTKIMRKDFRKKKHLSQKLCWKIIESKQKFCLYRDHTAHLANVVLTIFSIFFTGAWVSHTQANNDPGGNFNCSMFQKCTLPVQDQPSW